MEEEPEAGQFLAIARDAIFYAAEEATYDAANFAHTVASWDLDNAHTAIELAESDVEECAGDAGELAEVRDIADEAYRVARAAYNATDATLTPLRTAREEYRAALDAQHNA